MMWLMLVWYLTVQAMTVAALPVALRVLSPLPDRGYSLAKALGVLLVGVGFWLAYAYGLLRNERGAAWLVLLVVAVAAGVWGRRAVVVWWRDLREQGNWRVVVVAEALFATVFAVWCVARAYAPSANHTEQPMDLMFMNSIWASATFPPQDAWFAGYAISYYYLGYWLLTTIGQLSAIPPHFAYNLGQATWYGLLWLGCFGVVMNLLAWRFDRATRDGAEEETAEAAVPIHGASMAGGVLAGAAVALAGNVWVIVEWLYAQGLNVGAVARWVDVYNFPERASQTGQWFIGYDWWWWRSSRVIEDLDLAGNHIEVIDEFPAFSYLLGDNHPHLLAMPVALVAIGLAFSLLLGQARQRDRTGRASSAVVPFAHAPALGVGGLGAALVAVVVVGSLLFLNTWDFPPYWALVVGAVWLAGARTAAGQRWGGWFLPVVVGGALLLGGVALVFPYMLTAQSQAGGIVPNLFYPTRLPQWLAMFGGFVPTLVALLWLGWRRVRPTLTVWGWTAALVWGIPLVLLTVTTLLATTPAGQGRLQELGLPVGAAGMGAAALARWMAEPWTLVVVGALLSVTLACLVTLWQGDPLGTTQGEADLVFVLGLVALGLGLVYVPEVVYLRDNFGTRMNTIFKFYYQAWLLFGLASAYVIAVALRSRPFRAEVALLALLSLALVSGSLIFLPAGLYSKTGGFNGKPTLDARAYLAQVAPDVMAAVAWVEQSTPPTAVVLEGKGSSYRAEFNRISTMTGRPTLLGWDGHQAQWRGDAYGEMARGRPEALELIYQRGTPAEVVATLRAWGVDYVFIGPTEIEQYGISPGRLDQLTTVLDEVFARGQVRVLRVRPLN